jgi:hypothetical protein
LDPGCPRCGLGDRDVWSWQINGLSLVLSIASDLSSIAVYFGGNKRLFIQWSSGHADVRKYAPGAWEQRARELSLHVAEEKPPVAETPQVEATR